MMETTTTMMIVLAVLTLSAEMVIYGIKVMVKKNVMTITRLIQTNARTNAKSRDVEMELFKA
jgi:cell shape-determining protein MreD